MFTEPYLMTMVALMVVTTVLAGTMAAPPVGFNEPSLRDRPTPRFQSDVSHVEGTLQGVDVAGKLLTVETQGSIERYELTSSAKVTRNSEPVGLEELVATDYVVLVLENGNNDSVSYVKAVARQ